MSLQHTFQNTFSALLLAACAQSGFTQGTPGAVGGPIGHNDTRVHPGFSMTSLVPTNAPSAWPRVGALDFLPNGDLVVATWDGFGNAAGTTKPGRVYILKNVQTGDSTKVTYSQLGGNDMNEPAHKRLITARGLSIGEGASRPLAVALTMT